MLRWKQRMLNVGYINTDNNFTARRHTDFKKLLSYYSMKCFYLFKANIEVFQIYLMHSK